MENNCLHDETVILVLSVVYCTQAWFYELLTEVFLFFFFLSNLSVASLGDLFTWMRSKNLGIHLPVL